jgi:TPP-dependent pyruvate/acetoin dehydrogenase alpha subunit
MVIKRRILLEEQKAFDMYRRMLIIRSFEQRLNELFKAGLIPGFVHLSLGQEAVAVGVCANLRKNDYITSTHRGHHHCIAKGISLRSAMAELFGKSTGSCKGRGGSMHLADASIGVLGTNGIVGDGIAIAAGAGLSRKIMGSDQIAVCFFGNGALTTGAFHESVNLIAIHKLPVVLICENNYYAVSMRFKDAFVYPERVVEMVQLYGIESISIDGNDLIAVYEESKKAIGKARKGDGPTFIECRTFRQSGHFVGDPEGYRSEEERRKGMMLDPILRFRESLIEKGFLTIEMSDRISEQAHEHVEDAVEFAKSSPWPDRSEVLMDY